MSKLIQNDSEHKDVRKAVMTYVDWLKNQMKSSKK